MFTFRFSSVFIFYVGSVLVSFVYNITFIILFLASFQFHIIQSLYLYNILIEYEIKYVHIRIYIYIIMKTILLLKTFLFILQLITYLTHLFLFEITYFLRNLHCLFPKQNHAKSFNHLIPWPIDFSNLVMRNKIDTLPRIHTIHIIPPRC